MRKVLLGLLFTVLFSSVYIFVFFAKTGNGDFRIDNNGDPLPFLEFVKVNPDFIFISLIFFIFIGIGILATIQAIITIIIRKQIKKKGIPSYGIIRKELLSDQHDRWVKVDVINPITNIKELIGTSYDKKIGEFPVNSYILCNYYNKHIIIEDSIPSDELDESKKELLK